MSLVSRRVVIRDLEFGAKIGIYTHERLDAQLIRINISLDVGTAPIADRIDRLRQLRAASPLSIDERAQLSSTE